MLTFTEVGHEYRWCDALVPSVTQVLAPLTDYSKIPPDRLAHARDEGIAIHQMIQLDVENRLDLALLPEWLEMRYVAWLKFCSETGFTPRFCERARYSDRIRVAGMPDLDGFFRKAPNRLAVVDAKRSFYAGRNIGLQTAGYEYLIESEEPETRVHERGALRLDANGTYKYESSNNPNSKLFSAMDRTVFLAAVAMHRWRTAA